ncbi:hypothetical protein pb186bvf_009432 [Paramecium bursaria]
MMLQFYTIQQSKQKLSNTKPPQIQPRLNSEESKLIQKKIKQLPFDIASLECSKNFVESQITYDKQSQILDDQEKTQAQSHVNVLDQIQDKAQQTNNTLNKLIKSFKTINQTIIQKFIDQINYHYNKIQEILNKIESDLSAESKQQRFFSQHNSEIEDKKQIIYNPVVLEKMLKRMKKQKLESKSLFRNQRLGTCYRVSLQHIPIGDKSPSIRSLDIINNVKTGPSEQLSQNALNFLKQLKKTKSTDKLKKTR